MLFHHSNRNYREQAAEAAAAARDKFNAIIEKGRTRAGAVIDQVQRNVPVDRIVKAAALDFEQDEHGIYVLAGDNRESLHPHALGQLAERAGIPQRYVNDLLSFREEVKPATDRVVVELAPVVPKVDPWGARLLANNFREIFAHQKARFLTRSVDGQVRGVLSDKFRRLDTRPILDAFVRKCVDLGALPIEGHALDTKVALKAVLPVIFEPVEHEVMVFGIHFGNSDFGDGAVTLRLFALRLWCTNFATTEELFREIHLGKRLADSIAFSEETYALDTKATVSAIGDIVGNVLSIEHIEKHQDRIRLANERGLDARAALADLRKQVGKETAEEVVAVFNSPDVVNLPAGNTEWRWSNALSWVAGQQPNEHKRLELEQLAGAVLKQAA